MQLPVWQRFYEEHQSEGIELLSVAMDAQGADRALPYVQRASASFTTVVDEANLLGQLYGFKVVPNGFLIDGDGVVRYRRLGGFDVRKAETSVALERWIAGYQPSEDPEQPHIPPGTEHAGSNVRFREGLDLYRQGNVEEAMALWRQALALDPDNYIIRKQMWAVENPDRFYAGDVDYRWQREQGAEGV